MLVKIYIIVLTESRSLNEKGFGFVRISQTRKTKQWINKYISEVTCITK